MPLTPPPSPGERGARGGPPLPTDTNGLPECQPPTTIELTAGETLELRIGPVAKRLRGAPIRMLAYYGPDVVSDRPDRCPRCGMRLLPMALCHISEHHESGMWFSLEVVPQAELAS